MGHVGVRADDLTLGIPGGRVTLKASTLLLSSLAALRHIGLFDLSELQSNGT